MIILLLTLSFITFCWGDTPTDLVSCNTTVYMFPNSRRTVQSPNFPNDYPAESFRCQWEFNCSAQEITHLEFICPTFDLESSPNCANDGLIVAQSKGIQQEKCGKDNPNGTITIDGWTRITFYSDSNAKTGEGFQCFIWCHDNSVTSTTRLTPESSTVPATESRTVPETESRTAPETESTSKAAIKSSKEPVIEKL